jgi:hypothetical protein
MRASAVGTVHVRVPYRYEYGATRNSYGSVGPTGTRTYRYSKSAFFSVPIFVCGGCVKV